MKQVTLLKDGTWSRFNDAPPNSVLTCPHNKAWCLGGSCDMTNGDELVPGVVQCDCVSHHMGCTERPYTRDSTIAALALLKIQGELA